MVLCERKYNAARNHVFAICLHAAQTDKEYWNQEDFANVKRYRVPQAIYKT